MCRFTANPLRISDTGDYCLIINIRCTYTYSINHTVNVLYCSLCYLTVDS